MSADLPKSIRVKISSEAAGEIAITPVVAEEMPFRDLIDAMLAVCGKDAGRIRDLLSRGSLVQGASRFRWEPVRAEIDAILPLLVEFPDPDPVRPFDAQMCIAVRLCGTHARIDLPRKIASERRLFQRRSFWDALMEAIAGEAPGYVEYSYRERADVYRAAVPADLRDMAKLIRYSGIIEQIARAELHGIELLVPRR